MYSGEGLVLGGKFEGYDQSDLTGTCFRIANRLNRNERVNSRGIEAYVDYRDLATDSYVLRFYIELVRMAELQDGMLNIQFA